MTGLLSRKLKRSKYTINTQLTYEEWIPVSTEIPGNGIYFHWNHMVCNSNIIFSGRVMTNINVCVHCKNEGRHKSQFFCLLTNLMLRFMFTVILYTLARNLGKSYSCRSVKEVVLVDAFLGIFSRMFFKSLHIFLTMVVANNTNSLEQCLMPCYHVFLHF